MLILLTHPTSATAQDGSLTPSLTDLGVGWTSRGGTVELGFSGRLDFEGYAPGTSPPWLIPDTDPFATGRLRLFGDLFLGDAWYVTAELRVDGGEEPRADHIDARVDQAFVRWMSPTPLFGIQAGKFASPFGSYPSRHHTALDPLIRPPLHYELRTMVSAREVPSNSAQFVEWKEPDRIEHFRAIGAPPIWGAPYPWGAMAFGVAGPFDYRVAILNSAPSSEPYAWGWAENPMDRPSWVGALGWQPSPFLRAELWHDRGPYLEHDPLGQLPGDWDPADDHQILWGGGVSYQRGYHALRAEVVHDTWEVPNVPADVVDVSYALEWVRKLGVGWFVATRFSAMEFLTLPYSGVQYGGDFIEGEARWDHPARRLQLGGGWRPFTNLEGRAEYMWNWTAGGTETVGDLFSLQLSWAF